LVLLAACGGHHAATSDGPNSADGPGDGPTHDGPTTDATPDGSPDASIDAPFVRGTVHVQVTNASSTAASCEVTQLHVVFDDVDGTITDIVADTGGNAHADVFPGASVTAVCERTSGTFSMVTVQDIEPGDAIVLDAARFLTGTQPADTTAAGTYKISYPAYSSAAGYTIYYPCGSVGAGKTQTTNISLAMQAGCVLSTMDLVVVASSNTGAQLAWTHVSNVTFTNNGSTTITDTWHPLVSVAASYANPPAFCADTANPDYPCDVQLSRYVPDMRGFRPVMPQMTSIAGSTAMITTPAAPGAATAVLQTRLENNGPASQVFTDVVDGTAGTYSIDFGAKTLPWMCQGLPQCPSFSGTNATLTIPVNGTGSYDLFETDVTYSRGPAFTTIYVWRIFGPTAGDVTFPLLPASVATVRPINTDRQSVTHSRICESDALAGWRAARQNPFDSLATCLQSADPTAPRYGGLHNRVSASQ
jgi:hypothetical protein